VVTTERPAAALQLLATPLGRMLLATLYLGLVWGTAQVASQPAGSRGPATWAAVAAFLLVFSIAALYPGRILILAAGALAVAMQLITPAGPALLAAIASVAVAGGRLARMPGRVAAALIGSGMLGALAISMRHLTWGQTISTTSSLMFTYVAAASLGELRRAQWRTAALLEEVVAGRDAKVRAAALDERARLAREVHDVLAHTLSALSIQLEGAWMLAEQQGCDPAIVHTLDRVTGLAREGLLEARRAVGSLRGDAPPGPNLLPTLVAEFERDTRVPATLRIDGTARALPPEAQLALYRTAQEALTNIRKHAEAGTVMVTLRYDREEVMLEVANQGRPRLTPLHGGGYGLVGLRERATLLGGRLEAGSTPDGYRVCIGIPV
jgi:signal transduction histidine kinase